MSCGGGHLGFPTGIKNRKFVEDLPMIIPGQFGFNLEIKDIKDAARSASYLELHLEIDSEGLLRTKLYDKRDN